jgi:hypothetical protein
LVEKTKTRTPKCFMLVRERTAINKTLLPKEWLLFACKSTRVEVRGWEVRVGGVKLSRRVGGDCPMVTKPETCG